MEFGSCATSPSATDSVLFSYQLEPVRNISDAQTPKSFSKLCSRIPPSCDPNPGNDLVSTTGALLSLSYRV